MDNWQHDNVRIGVEYTKTLLGYLVKKKACGHVLTKPALMRHQ